MNPVDFTILCLTIWREARSEPAEGRRAVLHVILNRIRDRRWPDTPYGVCLQPLQFSCHNASDPNSSRWPQPTNRADWQAWLDIQAMVNAPGTDPTMGANHYHTRAVNPTWAKADRITARIGSHVFYKL